MSSADDLIASIKLLLHPPPCLVHSSQGSIQIFNTCTVSPASPPFVGSLIQHTLGVYGVRVNNNTSNNAWKLHTSVQPHLFSKPESYNLHVETDLITIIASDDSGVFYALQTLRQIFEISLKGNKKQEEGLFHVPLLTIHDSPTFRYRGVMLDISRDKVYKLETVKSLVDTLAQFKYNQLQLYMEHTFAYKGHEEVWKEASPFTPEEMLELHKYCKDRFIDLVPNQNSFGHMHRWLCKDEYKHIAEYPEGITHGFNRKIEPYSICPTIPESLHFLKDLYAQLLLNFPGATQFNVGLDETFELGKGRSKAECEAKGVEVVYLEFLQKIYSLIKGEHPHLTMQFWGDIILHRPDLISKLPKDLIALDWGYEWDHPFARSTKHFSASGIPFYVCPGTSSWNSIGGRIDNCYENLKNAAENGSKNGAIGYLVTDWGDHGHWQQLPISYFGIIAGAGFGWNVDACASWETENGIKKIGEILQHFVLKNEDVVSFLIKLGRAYTTTKCLIGNQTALFKLINYYTDFPVIRGNDNPTVANLKRTEQYLLDAKREFETASKGLHGFDTVVQELIFTCDLMVFACHFGIFYASTVWEQVHVLVSTLPVEERSKLHSALSVLIQRYEALWMLRNRPGGLKESVGRLQVLLTQLG